MDDLGEDRHSVHWRSCPLPQGYKGEVTERLNTRALQRELHIRILSYDQVIDFPNPCLHCLQNEVFLVPSSESSQEDDLGLIHTEHWAWCLKHTKQHIFIMLYSKLLEAWMLRESGSISWWERESRKGKAMVLTALGYSPPHLWGQDERGWTGHPEHQTLVWYRARRQRKKRIPPNRC